MRSDDRPLKKSGLASRAAALRSQYAVQGRVTLYNLALVRLTRNGCSALALKTDDGNKGKDCDRITDAWNSGFARDACGVAVGASEHGVLRYFQ